MLIDATGKLGTVLSTRRVKQDVEDLGPLVARLLELRPVAFRYREDAAAKPDGPRQFGLIAEEVAEVFPELVVYDRQGKPQTVKYHLLGSLLLGELQRQHELLEELHRRLGERPEAIESRSPRGQRRRGGR
ncbi:MAG TPA: tail fiber domain-containing protein [Thermoanaerobaculia bacterium]|nr:tail fiber domain-containing protein [Thermoanaerobaculia bacterium]